LFSTLLVIGLLCLGVIGFAYSGLLDVGASSPHGGLTNWLLSTTSHASVERAARNIEVPDLGDEALVLAGINDFDSMCAGCHGAPGKMPKAMGQGLNPAAPDLAEEAAEMSPAELFWITKHGIKMTGMPAWGATHDDDALWPVVAFMTRLPELDEAGYQQMLADAVGQGHHSAAEPAGDPGAAQESGGTVHVHDDGSEHVHEASPEPVVEDDHSTHEH